MCLHVLHNLCVKFCRHSHNYRILSGLAKIWWLGKNRPTLHPGQTYIIHIRCSSSIENPNDCINFLLVKTKVMRRRCKNPGCKQRKFKRFFLPNTFYGICIELQAKCVRGGVQVIHYSTFPKYEARKKSFLCIWIMSLRKISSGYNFDQFLSWVCEWFLYIVLPTKQRDWFSIP